MNTDSSNLQRLIQDIKHADAVEFSIGNKDQSIQVGSVTQQCYIINNELGGEDDADDISHGIELLWSDNEDHCLCEYQFYFENIERIEISPSDAHYEIWTNIDCLIITPLFNKGKIAEFN